jgi:hypothetical protein
MELTKWPRLLVRGTPVTDRQAAEIIIRTDMIWNFISTNHHYWERVIRAEQARLGYPGEFKMARKPGGGTPDGYWEKFQEHEQRKRQWHLDHGILDLQYLSNERICSCWIGGPHGWVSWNGFIGCSTYNVGKWPEVREVTEEWTDIATAFPFLDLRAQLVPDEGEAEQAAVTWSVKDGRVTCLEEPSRPLTTPLDVDPMPVIFDRQMEIGCTRRQLHDALEIIR